MLPCKYIYILLAKMHTCMSMTRFATAICGVCVGVSVSDAVADTLDVVVAVADGDSPTEMLAELVGVWVPVPVVLCEGELVPVGVNVGVFVGWKVTYSWL